MLTSAFRAVVNKPFKEFFLHYFYRKYEKFSKKKKKLIIFLFSYEKYLQIFSKSIL